MNKDAALLWLISMSAFFGWNLALLFAWPLVWYRPVALVLSGVAVGLYAYRVSGRES